MRLSDQNLEQRTVIAADGLALGQVSAIFLDSETWRVESLQLRLHKDVADRLGASHNIFRAASIEVPVRLVQSVGDAVVLSLDVERLRRWFAGEEPGAEQEGPGAQV